MQILFQYERCRALANHQPVPVAVEGTRRFVGPIVEDAGRVQRIEYGRSRDIQFLRPSGDHDVGCVPTYRLEREADSLAS